MTRTKKVSFCFFFNLSVVFISVVMVVVCSGLSSPLTCILFTFTCCEHGLCCLGKWRERLWSWRLCMCVKQAECSATQYFNVIVAEGDVGETKKNWLAFIVLISSDVVRLPIYNSSNSKRTCRKRNAPTCKCFGKTTVWWLWNFMRAVSRALGRKRRKSTSSPIKTSSSCCL